MGDPAPFRTVFEDLGEEPVGGVTTHHLQAANPEDLPTDAIRGWVRVRGHEG